MTDKKLTPRVGDRVLVKSGGKTKVGNVLAFGHGETYASVDIDGWGVSGGFLTSDLQVVDRDPVKWPEGWEEGDHYAWGPDRVAVHRYANLGFSKQNLQDILATGPAMLRDWDELMGGAE